MNVIYGRNAVHEALRGRRRESVREIWASERTARERWLAGRDVRVASASELAERCGSSSHQGICASVGDYPYADAGELLAEKDPLIVVLDHVEDPQNLGSICRTAECAGVSGVVIHERRSASVTPAVCKASAGAVEHLRLAQVRNIADFLRDAQRAGCWSYGAAAPDDATDRAPDDAKDRRASAGAKDRALAAATDRAPDDAKDRRASAGAKDRALDAAKGRAPATLISYTEPDYSGGVVLVLGSEGGGLRPRVASACDQLISLPMHGKVQSLGVSAAAAALLYGILQDRASRA